jgi:tetratricopeptide (TPR) repeat protein
MKSARLHIIPLFIGVLLLDSCISVRTFSIDVLEPAEVMFPSEAGKVLIVNNSIRQPEGLGINRLFNSKEIPTATAPVNTDSACIELMDNMAATLHESGFFDEVSFLDVPLREKGNYFSIKPVERGLLDSLFNLGDFDAIISIDRYLFSLNEKIIYDNLNRMRLTIPAASDHEVFLLLKINGLINTSIYLKNNEKAVSSSERVDSVIFNNSYFSEAPQGVLTEGDTVLLFKVLAEFPLNELHRKMAAGAAKDYVPTWNSVERQIFTGSNSRTREAARYAEKNLWKSAETLWQAALEREEKPAEKFKLALNLALAYEMQDKLEKAQEWAEKAEKYSQEFDISKQPENAKYLLQYREEIKKRILNNRLLDAQLKD